MAWTVRHHNKWQGKYRDEDGKVKTAGSSTSKREAKKLAEDQEAKIRQGTWHDPSAGKIKFSVYFEEHWLPNRVLEDTSADGYLSHYNKTLRAEFGNMEVRKITGPVIQRWVVRMDNDGAHPKTLRNKFTTLQTCLGGRKGISAVRDGLIAKNPCEGVTLPPTKRRKADVYTVPETDTLMAEIAAWWRPIPILAAETGFRWGELMGLEVRDFSHDFEVIDLQRTITETTKARTGNGTPFKVKNRPKGGKDRKLRIAPEVATLVAGMVKARALFPGDRLFSMPEGASRNGKGQGMLRTGDWSLPLRTPEWPQGKPISRTPFRDSIWLPTHEATGVKQRRFHDLRGAHISWLLAGGADVVAVMERVGHEQMSTTMHYVDAMGDSDARALAALARIREAFRQSS